MTERKHQLVTIGFLILLSISLFFPLIQKNLDVSHKDNRDADLIKTSAQRSVTEQWIENPNFTQTPIEPTWYWENGTDGDNSDMVATTSAGQVNFEVLGETRTYSGTSGVVNSSTSLGWGVFNNSGYLPPHTAIINASGCFVAHHWDETDPPDGSGQIYNYPSIQFKKNVSLGVDISDYVIKSASLEVIFNASVNSNIDTPNDNYTGEWDEDLYEIGDFATFYVLISDLDNDQSYTIAYNRTKYLGQYGNGLSSILSIPDSPMYVYSQEDIITALNAALDKDIDHSNFTITIGLDIYSEDNDVSGDHDDWDSLMIKTCNLTFTYEKKIDHSTTVSWNQKGNKLGASVQVTDAKFFFKYKVNNTWPSSAPLSEIKVYINDKSYDEGIIKLSSANDSWQDAKIGGFDVTNLISTDENITVSIEVFLKDTFELDQVYSISIDEVYLNITYIETFPDYDTYLELFLDGVNKTGDSPVIQIPIDHMLNITVTYKDNVSANHISADSATLEGKVSGVLNETSNHYYFIVNSTELGLESSILTVTLQKTNYESQSIQILVDVVERATQLEVYISNSQINESDTFFSQYDEYLDITVNYTDDLSSAHVDGASVDILGIGSMDEGLSIYNFTLNTNNLTQGINFITVFAQKSNYQSQTIQFFINIQIRTTYIELYVEGDEISNEDMVNYQFDETLNVTVLYRDMNTDSHLIGADVDLLGLGSFDEIGTQFNFSVQTNNLTKGINILTVFSQLDGYQAQTIQFFIKVDERATEMILFINGDQINQSDTVEFEVNEVINITIFYKDNRTDAHLNGATLELLGVNYLNESGSQFNITINSNDLELGINILTVFAQIINYQPNSIQFFIEVVERATQIQLFLNGIDKTVDPVLGIPIGTMINITIKFYDNRTGFEIPSAVLQLIGESLSENLEESLIFNQYSLILNSSNLMLGVKLFTIVAQAPTYQINTVDIRITVNPVNTSINTVSGLIAVDIDPSEDFLIQIVLNNNDFGGTIKNATVTYQWENGQGILTDSNSDGIYEASLNNVPAGSYIININAYAGENFDFRGDFEIVLNVIATTGPDINIIIISLVAGLVGVTVAFVLYQKHFKYPPKVRMMRKMRKKVGKGKKLKSLTVNTREDIITSELENNREMLKLEKESVDKINKKTGGDSLE